MYNLIFKNTATLEVDGFSPEPHFWLTCGDWEEFAEVIDLLTEENLQSLQVTKNDTIICQYKNCFLSGTQTIHEGDGMTAHFYLSGQPVGQIDPDFKEAYDIILGVQ